MNWAFSPKHLKILTWWLPDSPVKHYFGIVLDGAVRSGKSLPGSVSFIRWIMSTFPDGGKFFIAGQTIASAGRNVIEPLMAVQEYLGCRMELKQNGGLLVLRSPTNAEYMIHVFGGYDERSQRLIQGYTSAGGFFDEASLMPKSFVDMALSRLSVEGATAWFTSNPSHPSHWFKKEYIDLHRSKGLLYLHLTMDDNYSLSEKVKNRYKSLYTGVFYRRYILGEWCAAEGLVYPEFMDRDDLAFDFSNWNEYTEMFVACDYGIQNAMVYLLFGWNTRALRWEVIKEWRHSGRETEVQYTDAEYYSKLVEFIGDRPVRDIIIDPSASSFIAVIRKSKRYRAILADNRVVAGISYTASLFHIGKLAICRDCEGLIEELGGYVWDEKKAQRTGEEYPLAVADHGPDALRYGCFTHIRRYEKRYGILLTKEAS